MTLLDAVFLSGILMFLAWPKPISTGDWQGKKTNYSCAPKNGGDPYISAIATTAPYNLILFVNMEERLFLVLIKQHIGCRAKAWILLAWEDGHGRGLKAVTTTH
jgi:hypothetical protein